MWKSKCLLNTLITADQSFTTLWRNFEAIFFFHNCFNLAMFHVFQKFPLSTHQSTAHYPKKLGGYFGQMWDKPLFLLVSSGFHLATLPWIPFLSMNTDLIWGEQDLQFHICSSGFFFWIPGWLADATLEEFS